MAASEPTLARLLAVFVPLLALMLAAPWLFRLVEWRTRRAWRRVGERLGLRASLGSEVRSLRGVVDGVDLDVVFQRRTDSARTTVVGVGDDVSTSSAASGLAFTGAPVGGRLDPAATGPELERLRRTGRVRLDERRLRWVPPRSAVHGEQRLASAVRRFLAAVEEARARPS